MGLAERLLNLENKQAKLSDFKPALQSLVQDLTSISQNVKVYVFGSVARKEMTTHSDIDLLIVLDGTIDKKKFRHDFYKIKRPIGKAVDVIFKNNSELNDSFFIDAIQSDLIELFPNWKLDG